MRLSIGQDRGFGPLAQLSTQAFPAVGHLRATPETARRFQVHCGHCKSCGWRVQGRHPLQTSDALGAQGVVNQGNKGRTRCRRGRGEFLQAQPTCRFEFTFLQGMVNVIEHGQPLSYHRATTVRLYGASLSPSTSAARPWPTTRPASAPSACRPNHQRPVCTRRRRRPRRPGESSPDPSGQCRP